MLAAFIVFNVTYIPEPIELTDEIVKVYGVPT